ncbi:hypothetical protein KRX51_03285 [Corynebacterium sp. TAE3-ERU12]|uniref:hypothetical protein n=1 Tax=Corynebacterium sp. TAE3-ERU12 TaxID=2849491 RepID=UPI001C46BD06|nr:hypothetical protein [Corynebacterium sp. TAE3-ERU12]MBV7294942.1 hypothetical protein [Corynebacterium sp. TAE3-ERU12]
MDPSIVVAVIALVGSVVGAWFSWRGTHEETATSQQEEFNTRVFNRLADVESRLQTMDKQLGETQKQLMTAEWNAHELMLELSRAIHALQAVMVWIDAGAKPPPPEVKPVLVQLQKVVEATGPHPREPPAQ